MLRLFSLSPPGAPKPPTMQRVEVAPESTHYVLVSPPPPRRCIGLRVALALLVGAAALLFVLALSAADVASLAAAADANITGGAELARIIIIRHGEKDHASGNGLAPAGRARAQYLARCMSQPARSLALPNGPPTLLMASESKKGKSHRSEDTVRPLADALHLDLDTSIKSSDVKLFAERTQEKLAADGTLVAAWHHETAPKLVEALLGHYGYQPEWPSKWPHECDEDGWSEPDSVQKGGRCYDLLWRMTLRRHPTTSGPNPYSAWRVVALTTMQEGFAGDADGPCASGLEPVGAR